MSILQITQIVLLGTMAFLLVIYFIRVSWCYITGKKKFLESDEILSPFVRSLYRVSFPLLGLVLLFVSWTYLDWPLRVILLIFALVMHSWCEILVQGTVVIIAGLFRMLPNLWKDIVKILNTLKN